MKIPGILESYGKSVKQDCPTAGISSIHTSSWFIFRSTRIEWYDFHLKSEGNLKSFLLFFPCKQVKRYHVWRILSNPNRIWFWLSFHQTIIPELPSGFIPVSNKYVWEAITLFTKAQDKEEMDFPFNSPFSMLQSSWLIQFHFNTDSTSLSKLSFQVGREGSGWYPSELQSVMPSTYNSLSKKCILFTYCPLISAFLLAMYTSHHSKPFTPLTILGCPGLYKILKACSLSALNKATSKKFVETPRFVSTASIFSPATKYCNCSLLKSIIQ